MRKHNQGFTLLEIIIVIIIIGVLASLALPRLFAMVEGARAAEAISTMSTIRASLERYYLMNNGTYGRGAINTVLYTDMVIPINKLDIENPAKAPGSHFDYSATGGTFPLGGGQYYYIVAYRNSLDGGDTNEFIVTTYNIAQGVGNGAYNITVGAVDGQLHWGATDIYKNFIPKTP